MTKRTGIGAGRPAKPTRQHKLHGTARPDRMAARAKEPVAEPLSDLTPPKALDGDEIAQEEWRDLTAILSAQGRMTTDMVSSLIDRCRAKSDVERYRALVKEHGDIFMDATTGNPRAHPYMGFLDRAEAKKRALDTFFGFTPISVSKVTVHEKPSADPEAEEARRIFGQDLH